MIIRIFFIWILFKSQIFIQWGRGGSINRSYLPSCIFTVRLFFFLTIRSCLLDHFPLPQNKQRNHLKSVFTHILFLRHVRKPHLCVFQGESLFGKKRKDTIAPFDFYLIKLEKSSFFSILTIKYMIHFSIFFFDLKHHSCLPLSFGSRSKEE